MARKNNNRQARNVEHRLTYEKVIDCLWRANFTWLESKRLKLKNAFGKRDGLVKDYSDGLKGFLGEEFASYFTGLRVHYVVNAYGSVTKDITALGGWRRLEKGQPGGLHLPDLGKFGEVKTLSSEDQDVYARESMPDDVLVIGIEVPGSDLYRGIFRGYIDAEFAKTFGLKMNPGDRKDKKGVPQYIYYVKPNAMQYSIPLPPSWDHEGYVTETWRGLDTPALVPPAPKLEGLNIPPSLFQLFLGREDEVMAQLVGLCVPEYSRLCRQFNVKEPTHFATSVADWNRYVANSSQFMNIGK